jgi:hypothetical protein
VQASLDYKQRLQLLFFPKGIAYDGNRFNRTAVTAPLFNYLAPDQSAEESSDEPHFHELEPARPLATGTGCHSPRGVARNGGCYQSTIAQRAERSYLEPCQARDNPLVGCDLNSIVVKDSIRNATFGVHAATKGEMVWSNPKALAEYMMT